MCAAYDKQNKQIVGKLGWRFAPKDVPDLTYSVVVLDQSGKVQWFSDQRKFSEDSPQADSPTSGPNVAAPTTTVQEFGAAFAPRDANQRLNLGLRIFDNKKLAFVAPLRDQSDTDNATHTQRSASTDVDKTTQKLLTIDETTPIIQDPNFQLAEELSHNIRIYRNSTAVPAAYLATRITIANSAAEALSFIQAKDFDRVHDAVVELNDANKHLQIGPGSVSDTPANIELNRPSAERVVANTDCQSKSLLVLTDTFFPGWECTVDGSPTEILRTNSLFRGVVIPAGKHEVVFAYRPASFLLGLTLALTAVTFMIFAGLFSLRNKSLKMK